MSYVARSWRRARRRGGWHRGAPCGADKLGDGVDPVLVEVVDGSVAQELMRHEERAHASMGGRRAWEEEPAGVSDGVTSNGILHASFQ